MSVRVVAGVQARLSSRRLPGKVLCDVAGMPLIQRVVERARAVRLVDEVFVLTSDDPSDDPLVERLEELAIPFRRGPLEDVLERFMALVHETAPEHVVRVCADSPLLEPAFVDRQIEALRRSGADLVAVRGNEAGECEGTLGGASAMSAAALLRARMSRDPRDREHVGSFFFRVHHDRFERVSVHADDVYRVPGLRLCVDEAADLDLVRRVHEHFGERDFTTADAIRFLLDHPEVRALNAGVVESGDNRDLRRLSRAQDRPDPGRRPA